MRYNEKKNNAEHSEILLLEYSFSNAVVTNRHKLDKNDTNLLAHGSVGQKSGCNIVQRFFCLGSHKAKVKESTRLLLLGGISGEYTRLVQLVGLIQFLVVLGLTSSLCPYLLWAGGCSQLLEAALIA